MRKPNFDSGKKVVRYDTSKYFRISVGTRADVITIDHTNHHYGQHVINGRPASTSIVEAYDKATGIFETKYTLYIPDTLDEQQARLLSMQAPE